MDSTEAAAHRQQRELRSKNRSEIFEMSRAEIALWLADIEAVKLEQVEP